MGISDVIAGFINDILSEADGIAELQRAELANKFNCVPSQINYVISTRFSPEHGYVVESRRGGGGYIRISRVRMDPKMLVMHTVNAIGDKIDQGTVSALVSNLLSGGAIDRGAAKLILAATGTNSFRSLPGEQRDVARAGVLKQMLINL